MRNDGDEKAQRFSSGGRATGIIGLLATAVLLGYGVLVPDAGYAPWAWPMLLFVGVTVWAVLLRPALVVRGATLELREMLHSDWIPLARISDVAVTQVTRVTADGRTYIGSGMGRSRRQLSRDGKPPGALHDEGRSAGWLVEQKLARLAGHAREARELEGEEPPAIRRAWAWPEIAALVALFVTTVALALL